MAVHLIKLCVGVDTVEELQAWIDYRLDQKRKARQPLEHIHTTRMFPKREAEILGGGSLYWVIKGVVQCRQEILDLRRITDEEGIGRCEIVLKPKLVLTMAHPRRPFQGWRYLKAEDAPRDLPVSGDGPDSLPVEMQRELAVLGLM